MRLEVIDIEKLRSNSGQIEGLPANPRKWDADDVKRLAKSIEETPELLEARPPIVVPQNGWYVVLGGNMRLEACRYLDYDEIVCAVMEEGTPIETLKQIVVKDNGSFGEWDTEALLAEWKDLPLEDWGALLEKEQSSSVWTKDGLKTKDGEKDENYKAFEDKFKPKLTTDDCYTPPEVYDVVLKFVRENVTPIEDKDIIRPFRPGGDYKNEYYPEGCAVIDNPPFSILAEIIDFYISHKIRFFLFAPTLTLFSKRDCTFIVASAAVTYENGAKVNTSFVSNMCGNLRVWLEPTIAKSIADAQKLENDEFPTYVYPDCFITAAILGKISKRGLELKFDKSECAFVRNLDCLKDAGKGLYGGGFLLSERAAAERAAAERAAAERAAAERAAAEKAAAGKLKLSERELKIIEMLNAGRNKESNQ